MSWIASRLIGSVCAVAVIAFAPWRASAPAAALEVERRAISLLLVQSPDNEADNGLLIWSTLFKRNLGVLLSDISAPLNNAPGTAIRDVYVRTISVSDANRDDLRQWWLNAPSLQSISVFATKLEGSVSIDNDIYLGTLHGTLPDQFIHFSQDITPTKYKITRDALAIVTLYTYAMDLASVTTHLPSAGSLCRALSKAHSYQIGVDQALRAELATLFSAIDKALDQHKCAGR
jgi:hypothetical protein